MFKDMYWIGQDGEVTSRQRIFGEDLKPTIPIMSTSKMVEVVWPDGTWERFEITDAKRQQKIFEPQ